MMKYVIALIIVLLAVFAWAMAGTAIVWAIWNYVVCAIWTTLPAIGFWQVFLIMLLIRLVFGGLVTVYNNSKKN